jgi:two-component system CheB/CheR fusion protein
MKKLRRNVLRKRETAPKKTSVAKSPRSAERAGEEASSAAGQKAIPIVGIGASAGGLEAFTQLLHALPANTGMAYVLVQHLEPRHESMLTKLLAPATAMPVHEVREGMRIEPNHVYVIPANADLSLMDGLLHIVGRRAPAGRHLPIDYFLRSLAETRKSQAIGVILSGTASDGTAGLQAIKVEGGITFAQEPGSAKYDGMPRNAIAAGCVDFVLPPERIAAELARIASHPFVAKPLPEAVEALPAKEEDWTHLFRLLRTASGVDFTFYKKSTIRRRLARRMALHKLESIGEYLTFAEHHREEIDALFQEVLIPVTSFFRDPEVFAALGEKIFPQILEAKHPGDPVRIWAPGCSSGEEAYSIAICLLEHLGDRASAMSIQIFGTDVNDTTIEKARAGEYSELEMRDVSPERRRRFFTHVNGNYAIHAVARELCVFARQDVTKDPPFSKLDLLSCRNVLIYLEPILQERVLSLFHYALKDSGVLMLGKSESLGAFADLFTAIDRRNKFFSKNLATRASIEVAQTPQGILAPPGNVTLEAPPRLDLEREADRIVWERYAHSGIVVNNALQILHFRGDTSPYLQPAPGRATLSLMRMLREELQLELRAAVQEARKTGRSVRRESIPLKHDQQERAVSIEVRPLPVIGADEKCFLILFDEAGPRRSQPSKRPAAKLEGRTGWQRERQKLENELARTQAYLQAVIQEQETTNEELKTANEEAMSSMEELQSTNEELETAKEELQSSNEELVTLNEQLQNRNTELSLLSDDLSNVISGVDLPILILDSDRRIRRFTPPAQKLLGLLEGDVGRPIGNLLIGLNVPDLKDLITSIIEQDREIRREVQSEAGHWYLMRMRPFHTAQRKIEGVVMAFTDIHQLKQNQEALQKEQILISAILDSASDLLVMVLDREGRIVQFNRVCQQLSGYSLEEVRGRRPWEFMVPPDEVPRLKETFEKVLRGTPSQTETHWLAKDGRRLLVGWSNRGVAVEGSVESVIASGIDHTESSETRRRAVESEATVLTLLETAAQSILTVNQQGKILLVNAATDKMFGYSRDEIIGQDIGVLLPERFRQRHNEHVTKWFLQPIPRQMGAGLDLAGLRKDGTEFPVDVSLSSIQTADGIIGVAFVSDITERRKNEKVLLDYQKQLQSLSGNLMSVQETGNEELARELHDVFSQELAALAMEVSTLQTSRQVAGSLTGRLAELGRQIGQLAEQMHGTARRLHPAILKELGLEAALREECDKFSEQTGIPVRLMCEELPSALPDDVSLCLYRIAQESLLNIRKHAKASEALITVRGVEGGVSLRIEDSGDGFDAAEARKKGGLGLTSMEERVRLVNGKFDIRSQPGQGTTVEVFVPLNKEVT